MILSPASEAEASAAVSDCAAGRVPLAIEGGGTKGEVGRPIQTERTLTSRNLTGITLYEPAELVIGARAGTPLAAIEKALADKGQQFTFEPPDYRALLSSDGEPTVGGLAASNLSGPRRIQAGAVRDSLIGVRLVNGQGEVIKSGGRVMKNVTGLDLVKLVSGSWGTLCFLTEVTFKVLPRPEHTATLVLRGLSDADAITALSTALASPYEVTGAAHLPAGLGGGAQTLIRIEGFSFSVDYRFGELRQLLRRHGQGELIEGEAAASLWRFVRDVLPFAGAGRNEAVWRISTAPTKGHLVTAELDKAMLCRWYYDWGGGLVWLACPPAGDAGAAAIRAALTPHGGHATLMRAPSDLRATVEVFQPMGDGLARLVEGTKAAFDPARIFNPGRMHAGV